MSVYDLGDVVGLGVTVTDANGANANATTVTLTITLPDATTAGPFTVSPTSTGVYGYDYTPAAVGRYTARWVATGSNAGAFTDVFNVRPSIASIVSVDEARAALNWPSGDTTNDEELRGFLEAATECVEDLVGAVVSRTHTEQIRSGGSAIALAHYPVLSVSSLKTYSGLTATTWTQAATPDVATGNAYTLNSATGVLTARGATFGTEAWITYTAGRQVVPPSIREATVEIVKARWEDSQATVGRLPGQLGIEMAGRSGKTYVIPYVAEALLKPYLQAGGFA